MKFDLFQVLVFGFFMNSLFLLFLLWRTAKNFRKPSILIGLFLVLFNLEKISLYILPLVQKEISFILPHIPALFFLPAVLFFLILSILFPEKNTLKKYHWVLLPGILDVLYSLGSWWYVCQNSPDAPLYGIITGRIGFFFHQSAAIIFSLVLLTILLIEVKRTQIRFLESAQFVKIIIAGVTIIVIRWLVVVSLNILLESYSTIIIEQLFTLLELIFFMYVGIRVLITPRILKINYSGFQLPNEETLQKQAEILVQKVMERKLFLKPNISRKELAEAIQTSEANVSGVLLKGVGESFYQFISRLRIKEAIKYIDGGKLQSWSIETLAKEVGFKSKTTFYKVFKEETGLTPLEYARREEGN